MTKDELIEKLETKKSYQKKGVDWLAKEWDVDPKLVQECKKAVTSAAYLQESMNNNNENELKTSTKYLDHLKENGLTQADVKSVKFWQNMMGEQRFSIVTHNSWHEMPNIKADLLDYIKTRSVKVPKVKYKKHKDPICYEISLPDIHYGKITDEPMNIIEEHYIQAIMDLHKKADGLEIDRFLLPVGNDGLNSEGMSRATTKGTPQQDSMRWRESFRGYWHLVSKAIDYLAQFAPVDVIVVQGNHDLKECFMQEKF